MQHYFVVLLTTGSTLSLSRITDDSRFTIFDTMLSASGTTKRLDPGAIYPRRKR